MRLPPQNYFHSIVEIFGAGSCIFGTGTVIGPRQVLTCAHVIAKACGLSPDASVDDIPLKAPISLRRAYTDGAFSSPQPAKLVAFHSRLENSLQADLAVLEVMEGEFRLDGPWHDIPFFADALDTDTEEIFVCGFPADSASTRGRAVEVEYVLGGPQPNLWINAVARHGHGQEIRQGFSGAPAWSATRSRLVGLIAEADPLRRSATLIPTRCLQSVAEIRVNNTIPAATSDREDVPRPKSLSRVGAFRVIFDRLLPRLHYFMTTRLQIFSDISERVTFEVYLRDFAADVRNKIEIKTYIPPPSKNVSTLPPKIGNQAAPFRQLVKEIVGISEGGDAASAQISALGRRSRRVRRLIHLLTHSFEPLILLGEPGSGKSLTLQQVSLILARQNASRILPVIVIYIPAGRWQPVSAPDIISVDELVRTHCPKEIGPYLDELQAAGRLVIIFDGLDEMSREKYIEHTEALSKYAESRRGRVRTLFSCRIADFSPNFQHRRLVLLPFDLGHVRAYIQRQFGRTQIMVDGEKLRTSLLAKRIYSESLPIQARNPFVLSLLCVFLQENGSLPGKRVDLLDFYYRFNFERKRTEVTQFDIATMNIDQCFRFWGRVAFEITRKNQGTDIGVHEVRRLIGEAAPFIIEAGRRCGIIQQSLSSESHLLSFEHHRAQEYFTAWSIVHDNIDFDWRETLDIPRWQETLVNVAQMGGAGSALQILSRAMEEILEGINRPQSRLERAYAETLATERVELAARVARDLPLSQERDHLQEQIRRAVTWFLTAGNSVAKVKMLRVAQLNPNLATIRSLQGAIEDRASWVRDQAYLVAAGVSGRISESGLPDELAYSYASNRLLGRFRSYFTLSRQFRNAPVLIVGLLGVVLQVIQTFMLALAVVAMFDLTQQALGDRFTQLEFMRWAELLSDFRYKLVIAASALASLFLSMRYRTGWLYSQMLAVAVLIAPLFIVFWQMYREFVLLWVGLVIIVAPVCFALMLIYAFSVMVVFSSAFGAALSLWSKSWKYVRSCVRLTLVESSLKDVALWFGAVLGSAIFLLAFLGALVGIIVGVARVLSSHIVEQILIGLSDFILGPMLKAVMVLAGFSIIGFYPAILLVALVMYANPRTRESGYHHKMLQIASRPLYWFFQVILILAPVMIVIAAVFAANAYLPGTVAVLWYLGAVVMVILVTVVAIFLLRNVYFYIRQRLDSSWVRYRFESWRSIRMNPKVWVEEVKRAKPAEQARLIYLAKPDRMGMSVEDFFKVLIEIEPDILFDPALSAYGSKCAQVLELVRQKRVG